MPLQSSVAAVIPAGYIGEAALDGPTRIQPAALASAGGAANNIMGRAFTVVSGATGQPLAGDGGANPAPMKVQAGGTGVFAGIMMYPKAHAQASLTAANLGALPDGVIAQFAQEHPGAFVLLPAASEVGDLVYFLTANGSLVSAAPDADAPANAHPTPIGEVVRYDGVTAGGGLFVMHVGPVQRASATA